MNILATRVASLSCLAAAAWISTAASALDIVKASAPTTIVDHRLQIGARTVKLPPGEWVLIERDEFEMNSGGPGFHVDAYRAWAMLLDESRFRAIVRLEMPVADQVFVGDKQDSLCHARAAMWVQDFSGQAGRDCIALFGNYDMRRHLLARGPLAERWTERHRIKELDTAMQIAYQRRQPNSVGRIDVYLPTGAFSADEEAREWARSLRDSVAPLFEGDADSVELPKLPVGVVPDGPASGPEAYNEMKELH